MSFVLWQSPEECTFAKVIKMKIYEEYITNWSQDKLKLVPCISIYHGKNVIIEHRVFAGRKDLVRGCRLSTWCQLQPLPCKRDVQLAPILIGNFLLLSQNFILKTWLIIFLRKGVKKISNLTNWPQVTTKASCRVFYVFPSLIMGKSWTSEVCA